MSQTFLVVIAAIVAGGGLMLAIGVFRIVRAHRYRKERMERELSRLESRATGTSEPDAR